MELTELLLIYLSFLSTIGIIIKSIQLIKEGKLPWFRNFKMTKHRKV